MNALDAANAYAAGRHWPIFPCTARKRPITENGFYDATTDPDQIRRWWTDWPHALIGMPTGERTGIAALDIDVKNGHNGFRTLAGLGYCNLPQTPTVLTPTGGTHLHFERPEGGFRCTVGEGGGGIGDGLDWRCDGGYIVLPSPGSGYAWGEWHYDNRARLPVPVHLLPREAAPNPFMHRMFPSGPTVGSLAGVLRCLHGATHGERNRLLFWASCRFARAVALGLIAEDDAGALLHQGGRAVGLDEREIARTIASAFRTGSRHRV